MSVLLRVNIGSSVFSTELMIRKMINH